MGSNVLSTQIDGTNIVVDDINQYKDALAVDNIPRNSNGLGESLAGSLGSSTYQWLNAFIETGFWDIGDIKAHHTYNDLAGIGQGWFPCVGDIINETNYDLIHGAGSWAQYIVSTVFDGKYSPNLNDKYIVGASDTNQDGTLSITTVGNASNEISIEHSHIVNDHNHQWLHPVGGANAMRDFSTSADMSYDSSGNLINLRDQANTGEKVDLYTNKVQASTSGNPTANQNIQPESIAVIFYLRIV